MIQLGNDWDLLLQQEFSKDYYQNLRKFLIYEYQHYQVYPNMYDIYNALKYTAYQDVKVVILGQDPYHGPNQAHGLSFSVRKGITLPPSLQNIFLELKQDVGCDIPTHGDLSSWAKQGVLLLNTVLTVRQGCPNSHANKGWENLTDAIIQKLNERKDSVIFLLWGKHAQSKIPLITNTHHILLKCPHPSPYSAHYGFFGCRHFSLTNTYLRKLHKQEIDWQLP